MESGGRAGRWIGLCLFTLVLTLMLIATLAPGSAASGQSSARSIALAGAYTGLATGVEAARYNPANLGLGDRRNSELQLVGVGVNLTNNSLTLDDYNRYTGAVLSQEDKDYLLGKIPTDGLHLTAEVEATAMSISFGSFVLSTTGVGAANINLNRDVIDLILNGNTIGEDISLEGSYSDVIGYVETGLSYGMPLYSTAHSQLAVGATAKYIRGLAVERITELDGSVNTWSTGFEGSGNLVAQTATGGSGWGVDVGAALKLSDDYSVGLSVRNLISNINWTNNTEEHGYIFSFDTMTVDNISDDYIVSEEYTEDIDPFSTSLPQVMTVGLANTTGKLLWAIDWVQGFETTAGSSAKPRIAAGAEWLGLGFVPLRAGFGTGGIQGTGFSFGSGLNLSPFVIDAAVQTGATLSSGSAKGLNVAFSIGLDF